MMSAQRQTRLGCVSRIVSSWLSSRQLASPLWVTANSAYGVPLWISLSFPSPSSLASLSSLMILPQKWLRAGELLPLQSNTAPLGPGPSSSLLGLCSPLLAGSASGGSLAPQSSHLSKHSPSPHALAQKSLVSQLSASASLSAVSFCTAPLALLTGPFSEHDIMLLSLCS